jgi:hypothetical protein
MFIGEFVEPSIPIEERRKMFVKQTVERIKNLMYNNAA